MSAAEDRLRQDIRDLLAMQQRWIRDAAGPIANMADREGRLERICRLHAAIGRSSEQPGICDECGDEWPCPTYDLANWKDTPT